jgi:hypothetical protein
MHNNFNFAETDIVTDPIFKKVQGLKKVLSKYTNKTFLIKEENSEFLIENSIKIKICEFLSYLLDMR